MSTNKYRENCVARSGIRGSRIRSPARISGWRSTGSGRLLCLGTLLLGTGAKVHLLGGAFVAGCSLAPCSGVETVQ